MKRPPSSQHAWECLPRATQKACFSFIAGTLSRTWSEGTQKWPFGTLCEERLLLPYGVHVMEGVGEARGGPAPAVGEARGGPASTEGARFPNLPVGPRPSRTIASRQHFLSNSLGAVKSCYFGNGVDMSGS